jgi:bifunctional enzyme CysN/CysC
MYDPKLIAENIEEFLAQHESKELLRFVTIGSVDDGKSTLIGRLLHDTGAVYEDQLDAVRQATTRKPGQAAEEGIDLALITDGLKAEREQGITIDVAYRYFTTEKRKFIIADTPGHEQYTRNMATGASTADVAIILIDARYGVLAQTRRHAYIAGLLGIPNLIVCINKLDLMDWSAEVYHRIVGDLQAFTAPLGFREVRPIPISALKGDNVVNRSQHMAWYDGPCVLQYLETVPLQRSRAEVGFAFPVQYVLRPDLDFRGFAGSVAAGSVKAGDEVVVLPSGRRTRVKRIVTADGDLARAHAPQSVVLTLTDEVDLSRGDILASPQHRLRVSRQVEAHLVWMSDQPMEPGRQYLIKHTSNHVTGAFTRIEHRIDIHTLAHEQTGRLALNEIGRVSLNVARPLVAGLYQECRELGAFIVIDRISNLTVGAGMICGLGADTAFASGDAGDSEVTPEERGRRHSQKPVALILSGLPGTSKMRIARALERRLFDAGHLAFAVDRERLPGAGAHGDGVGLEHLIQALRLATDMGMVVAAAFTLPRSVDRQRITEHLGRERVVHIHLTASVDVRQTRLAKEGRQEQAIVVEDGSDADLRIDTSDLRLDHELDRITSLLRSRGFLS